MPDFIKDFWGIFVAALGGMVWLIRLEARIAINAAAIARLGQQRTEDIMAAREARVATNEALKEVKAELVEIRADIKELLRASK